jgi:Transposase DDE domain
MPSIAYLLEDVTQLHAQLQQLFTVEAAQLAEQTKFTQRPGKFTGPSFAQTLVFGYLHKPDATLPELASYAADFGTEARTQALDQRFTPQAAAFMRQILECALHIMVQAQALTNPLFERFSGIYVLDSTTIALPAALAAQWPALGNRPDHPEAAVKVFVMLELRTGQVWVELRAGNTSDHASELSAMPLPAGALRLADLGFYDVNDFIMLAEAGAYVLTRWRARTKVYRRTGQALDLVNLLGGRKRKQVEMAVLWGGQRFACRMLAQRLPAAVAARRRAELLSEAQRRGAPVSEQRLALVEWEIMFSNLPLAKMSLSEGRVLYRLRWQIELLFKLWKQEGKVDESRSAKAWHVITELYAKLTAMLLHHWLVVLGCWGEEARGMLKLGQLVRDSTLLLITYWEAGVATWGKVVARLQREVSLHYKINKRQKSPAAHQLVASITTCL